jgi:hypothetical protein
MIFESFNTFDRTTAPPAEAGTPYDIAPPVPALAH